MEAGAFKRDQVCSDHRHTSSGTWMAARPLVSPTGTELYALTRALTLVDGKRASIYTDSHYAFATCISIGPFTKREAY
jgi:hypothetical protein